MDEVKKNNLLYKHRQQQHPYTGGRENTALLELNTALGAQVFEHVASICTLAQCGGVRVDAYDENVIKICSLTGCVSSIDLNM